MLNIKTKQRLYARLYKWARAKYRETYLEIYRCDSKCANCNQWNSIIRLDYENFSLETAHGYMTKCGCCKKTTFWNCGVAPFPVVCDARGYPIQDK